MKKLGLAIATASILAVTGAQANDRTFGEIYVECGLGGMIGSTVQDKSTSQILAIVTNVTWDLGTTAISSNITSPGTCQNTQVKTAALIFETYPQLEADLAKGEGPHLTALLNVAGCDAKSHAQVVQGLRADLAASASAETYATQTRFEQAEVLHGQLSQRAAGSCSI